MRVTEISYVRRKNLGSYEYEELSMSAVIEEGENTSEEVDKLKNEVLSALGIVTAPTPEPVKETKVKEEKPKVKKEPKQEIPPVIEKEEEETPEPPKLPETKEKKAPKKEKVVEPTPYDRDKQTHKDLFANLLNTSFPGWSTDKAAIGRAKHASLAMVGEDFLNEKGEILPTFKEAVNNLMAE